MIDAHQHCWKYSPHTHGWIDESMRALKRDFLPRDLKPLLDANGFEGCVAVQAATDVKETEWLLDLADAHDWIRGVVGWVDLCASDVGAELARLTQRKKLRGIRHIVQSEPDDRFMLRADFERGIEALSRSRLTYDILVYPHQLPATVELTARHPNQPFVLDHLGKPPIKGGTSGKRAEWTKRLRELARNANVMCKLSGLVTEADWTSWKESDLGSYLDVAFDAFGPRRLMIGSDWPVCLLAGDYSRVVGVVTSWLEGQTSETREAILGGNAARFYCL